MDKNVKSRDCGFEMWAQANIVNSRNPTEFFFSKDISSTENPTLFPGELGLNGLESSFFVGTVADPPLRPSLSEEYGLPSK